MAVKPGWPFPRSSPGAVLPAEPHFADWTGRMVRSTLGDTRRGSAARDVATCSPWPHVQSANPSAPSDAEELGATHPPKSHCCCPGEGGGGGGSRPLVPCITHTCKQGFNPS